MKLAFSNLAWDPAQDAQVAAILIGAGFSGVEVAPTKVWQEPLMASISDLTRYRERWSGQGLSIVALQSLLFGRPELLVFSDDASVAAVAKAHLKRMIELAGVLKAGSLVFGSPKNRRSSHLTPARARSLAIDLFEELGEHAARHETLFCIEPNPLQYGCDFATRAHEARSLVEDVASPGFRLHLDLACMRLAGDAIQEEIEASRDVLCHFHISSGDLRPVSRSDSAELSLAADALKRIGYKGWVSVEMIAPPSEALALVSEAALLVVSAFQD